MTLILVILSIVLSPIGVLYGINTLFGTMIPYTIETWFSVFFFGIVIRFLVTPVVIQQHYTIQTPDKNELPPSET